MCKRIQSLVLVSLAAILLLAFCAGVSAETLGTENGGDSFYAVLDGQYTLSFYYDSEIDTREGTKYPNLPAEATGTASWGYDAQRNKVKKVVINESVKNYTGLKTTLDMFSYMYNAEGIEGCEYLYISNVSDLGNMFRDFGHDISDFAAVPNVAGWDTGSATSMYGMFWGYASSSNSMNSLPDISGWNVSKVKNMNHMFDSYAGPTTTKKWVLDLSGWNTAELTSTVNMFWNVKSLATVYVDSSKWKTPNDSSGMFNGCDKLAGGKGTAYDPTKVDGSYARVDYGEDKPGYFSLREQELSFPGVSQGTVTKAVGDKPFTEDVTGAKGAVTYTSGDPAIATVDKTTGEVTVRSPGTTKIMANAEETGTHYKAGIAYTLNVFASFTSKDITAEITETGAAFSWKHVHQDVSSYEVYLDGKLLSTKQPEEIITCNVDQLEAGTSHTLTVHAIYSYGIQTVEKHFTTQYHGGKEKVAVESFKVGLNGKSKNLKGKTFQLKLGEKQKLHVFSFKPADATNLKVKWRSSNTKVCTVKNGVLVAKGKGVATITVTSRDGSGASVAFKVKVVK